MRFSKKFIEQVIFDKKVILGPFNIKVFEFTDEMCAPVYVITAVRDIFQLGLYVGRVL